MKNISKTWNSPRAALMLAAASLVVGTIHAQEAAGTDVPTVSGQAAVTLDPYVIHEQRVVDWNSQTTFSGSRTAQNLLDIPVNISILTKDYLKDIGATDLLSILPYAASGVSQRVTYREDLTVRGFRQTMLVDGLASDHTFNMLPLYNVQTVEIVKGPTALVFNNFGNVSGTVNYVTKRPSVTPDYSGDLQVTVGNYGTYIGEATVYGPLSKDGSVRYRFTVGAQQQAGWFGRSLKDDTNYSNNNEFSASVDWNVNRKLTIQTDFSYIFTEMRDNSEALIDPATNRVWKAEVDGYNTTASWAFQREQLYHGRIAAIFQANAEVSVRALFNTTRQHSNYNLEDAELNTTVNGVVVPNGLQIAESPNYRVIKGMAAQTFFYYPGIDDTIIDLTWSHAFSSWFSNRLNAGYDYNNAQNNYIDYITPQPDIIIGAPVASRGAAPVLIPANIVSYAPHVGEGGWSGYVEDAVSFFNNKLSVNGGGRYVSGSMDTINHQLFVPNIGVLYHVLPVMSLYASSANSFTPKTGYDVFGHQFTDQIGKSKEVGLKFNAFNEHLFGTIDYFDIVYKPGDQTGARHQPAHRLSHLRKCPGRPANEQGRRGRSGLRHQLLEGPNGRRI